MSNTDLSFDSIQKNSLQISLAKKQDGEAVVIAYLMKAIDELSQNVPNDLTADQKAIAAKFLMKEYWYLRTDDIISCFKNAIGGKYGKIFHKVTLNTICEWLNIYFETKQEHFATKKNESDWRELNPELFKPFTVGEKKKENPNNKINPMNDMAQKWLNEFDSLRSKKDNRFAEYNGKMLDFDEFIKEKIKEQNKK